MLKLFTIQTGSTGGVRILPRSLLAFTHDISFVAEFSPYFIQESGFYAI
jgi:hypothetical protein